MVTTSDEFDELETKTTNELNEALPRCATLIEFSKLSEAKQLINHAAFLIRELQRLQHKRRGRARERVGREIRYYSIWQTALGGRLEVIRSEYRSKVGFGLLDSASTDAKGLSYEYWNTTDYDDLVKRIDSWRLAARRRKVGTTLV